MQLYAPLYFKVVYLPLSLMLRLFIDSDSFRFLTKITAHSIVSTGSTLLLCCSFTIRFNPPSPLLSPEQLITACHSHLRHASGKTQQACVSVCIAYSPVIHPAFHQQLIVYLGTNMTHCSLLFAEIFHSQVTMEEFALFSVKSLF